MVNLPKNDNQAASSDDEDDLSLRADTIAVLNEFLNERALDDSRYMLDDSKFEQLFGENWQLSQFWYDDATKRTLAKVCLKLILNRANRMPARNVKVALLSCPSLYKSIRNIHSNGIVRIFEYDQRFSVYADDYIHYDYKLIVNDPEYMTQYTEHFDIIIADPPFLSEECIHAMSMLINRMRKPDSSIILCSGDVIADWAKTHMDLKQCEFRPQHERNLANEFGSFANFNLDELV